MILFPIQNLQLHFLLSFRRLLSSPIVILVHLIFPQVPSHKIPPMKRFALLWRATAGHAQSLVKMALIPKPT
jgi:hypothetical protein